MASITRSELITLVSEEVMDLDDLFESGDYSNAVDAALRDTGWTLPTSDDFQKKWIIDRTKRHLIYFLLFDSSKKFKVKQYSLDQKFDHYYKLLRFMDNAFIDAQEQNPYDFAGVDAYKMFGTKIDAGFSYDGLGRERTFDDENTVKDNY